MIRTRMVALILRRLAHEMQAQFMESSHKKWLTLPAVIVVCGAAVTCVFYSRGTATLAEQRVTFDGRIFELSVKQSRRDNAVYAEVRERVSPGRNGMHSVLMVRHDQSHLDYRECQIQLDELRRQFVFKCRQEAVCSFDPVSLSLFPISPD